MLPFSGLISTTLPAFFEGSNPTAVVDNELQRTARAQAQTTQRLTNALYLYEYTPVFAPLPKSNRKCVSSDSITPFKTWRKTRPKTPMEYCENKSSVPPPGSSPTSLIPALSANPRQLLWSRKPFLPRRLPVVVFLLLLAALPMGPARESCCALRQ